MGNEGQLTLFETFTLRRARRDEAGRSSGPAAGSQYITWPDFTFRLRDLHESVTGRRIVFFGLGCRAEPQLLGDSVMLALRGLLFSAAASTALLTNANADTPVSITYVPKSLAEASIASGPWTLHQAAGRNPRRLGHRSACGDQDALQSAHHEIWYALRGILHAWSGAHGSRL